MYTFFKDKILDENKKEIMMEWETPIMEEHAKIATENGGDILEIGFGMGICSNFIQQHNIKSHTIIEINDQVFERLLEWSKDKPNVIPIKGDWFDSIPNKKYNGVMYDTWEDKNFKNFIPTIKKYLKPKGIITYYDQHTKKQSEHNSKISKGKITFNHISVNPPIKEMKYKYYTKKDYYCIKMIVD